MQVSLVRGCETGREDFSRNSYLTAIKAMDLQSAFSPCSRMVSLSFPGRGSQLCTSEKQRNQASSHILFLLAPGLVTGQMFPQSTHRLEDHFCQRHRWESAVEKLCKLFLSFQASFSLALNFSWISQMKDKSSKHLFNSQPETIPPY